jgi:hypothetical protein
MAGCPVHEKPGYALKLIQAKPELWFSDRAVEQRDLDLLAAERASWLDYGPNSYLRKIVGLRIRFTSLS